MRYIIEKKCSNKHLQDERRGLLSKEAIGGRLIMFLINHRQKRWSASRRRRVGRRGRASLVSLPKLTCSNNAIITTPRKRIAHNLRRPSFSAHARVSHYFNALYTLRCIFRYTCNATRLIYIYIGSSYFRASDVRVLLLFSTLAQT